MEHSAETFEAQQNGLMEPHAQARKLGAEAPIRRRALAFEVKALSRVRTG